MNALIRGATAGATQLLGGAARRRVSAFH